MIEKREVNLTPSDIKNLMPTYSLCKGRRFSFRSQDGTSFKNISLNNLILVIKNAAVKKPEENISEINNFIEIFKTIKDKGYKTPDDQINQENFLTRIITKIKHFFSKTQRDNLLKELEQVAVRANSKFIVPENRAPEKFLLQKKIEANKGAAQEIAPEKIQESPYPYLDINTEIANSKIIVPENQTPREIIAAKKEGTQGPAHEIVSENQAPGITPQEKKEGTKEASEEIVQEKPQERTYLHYDKLEKYIKNGDVENAKNLLEILSPPYDAKDFFNSHKYLLPRAATANNLEMVKLLLKFKADPNIEIGYRYGYPIAAAVERGNLEMIKLLLENEENKIDLSQLVDVFYEVPNQESYFDILHYLIDHGAVLNPKTYSEGNGSPLASVFLNWDKDPEKAKIVLEMMINRGARLFDFENAKIQDGRMKIPQECYQLLKKHNLLFSPLIQAIYKKDFEQVKQLVIQENDVNIADANGLLPLHWAALKNHLEAVEILISKTDINSKGPKGNTALAIATNRNNIEISKFLLGQNADANIENDDGKLPADLAQESRHLEMYKLLLPKSNRTFLGAKLAIYISTLIKEGKLNPETDFISADQCKQYLFEDSKKIIFKEENPDKVIISLTIEQLDKIIQYFVDNMGLKQPFTEGSADGSKELRISLDTVEM